MAGSGRSGRYRAVVLAVALAGALMLAGALQAGVARAGSYLTFACHDAAGEAMPADLVAFQNAGAFALSYFRTTNTCAAGGQGSLNLEVGGCTPNCYFGDLGVSYVLLAPAGVSIASYRARYVAFTNPCDKIDFRCQDGQGMAYAIDSQRAPPNYAFLSLGQGSTPASEINASGLEAKFLAFFAGCNTNHGNCRATGSVAALYVSSLSAVFDDRTVPVVGGVGGSLTSGKPLSGMQTVTYSAQDAGGGIYAEHAYLDGTRVVSQLVDSNGGRCVDHGTVPGMHSFGYVKPCKSNVSASLNLDTTRWLDGAHQLKIEVEDAAGDLATVFDGSVTSANGRGGAAAAACSPSASGSLAVGRRGLGTLAVHLTCGGRAMSSVPALVQDDRGLRRQVTTDSDGQFRIAKTHTHSRLTVTVSGVTLPIVPELHSISLAISPHVTTNHHAMIWRGLVQGGRPGMKLLLEVRKGRKWDIFDQTSVDGRGRYRYRYRFRATTGTVRYTFRVVAREGGTVSPSRSVLVRG